MMLLSPQQRLIPFNTDIWKKLWDKVAKLRETCRFKPSQAADKLLMSLGCYQVFLKLKNKTITFLF